MLLKSFVHPLVKTYKVTHPHTITHGRTVCLLCCGVFNHFYKMMRGALTVTLFAFASLIHSTSADVFYFLSQDARMCAFPMCGGFFLTPVNNASNSSIYVSEITGVNDTLNLRLVLANTIVQGTIDLTGKYGKLSLSEPNAVFQRLSYNLDAVQGLDAKEQTFYLVGITGIQCPRLPVCPSFIRFKINAAQNTIGDSVQMFNEFNVEMDQIPEADFDDYIAAARSKSIITSGDFELTEAEGTNQQKSTFTPNFIFIRKSNSF
jgi:hypothetical protein